MNTTYKKIIIGILANVAVSFNSSAVSDALKIKVINGNTSDETVVRFLPGATSGFDGNYDAYKLFSTSAVVPAAFTRLDSATALSVNAMPSLNSITSIALYTHIKVAGNYTFQAIELGTGFPAGVIIKLEDTQTGISYNFRHGQSFSVFLPVNTITTSNRFTIHFTPVSQTNISSIAATCNGFEDGSITATKTGNTDWSYELKDATSLVVRADSGINETAVITGLAAGTYMLYTHATSTSIDSAAVIITEPLPVVADFSSSSDTVLLSQAIVYFSNTSNHSSFYNWDFGDGTSTVDSISPYHQYFNEGSYTVSLLAADSVGCTSQTSKNIVVLADPELATTITEKEISRSLLITQTSGLIEMRMFSENPSNIAIAIYNNMGQLLYNLERAHTISLRESLQINNSGTYIISSIINGKKTTQKLSVIL
ncbi:MAG: hypothetical protein K0Q95_388 [Bacteroidota bacterium]|jgi:PKD repeat protein|nr:hypothetical protein [Bacteroidota bacterium]